MVRLVFALVWTLGTLALALATAGQVQGWQRVAIWAFPAVGAGFAVLAGLHLRRARSLRIEREGGVEVYVWTDLAGRRQRSTDDPRPGWGDGDGDGDGGD